MKVPTSQFPKSEENLWARGCPSCTFGIVAAPELTGAVSLHMERLVQHIAGDIEYCACHAGVCCQSNLKNIRQRLIEEARRDPRMAMQAKRLTHPDVEAAQAKVADSYAYAPTPPIRFVEPPAPPLAQAAVSRA